MFQKSLVLLSAACLFPKPTKIYKRRFLWYNACKNPLCVWPNSQVFAFGWNSEGQAGVPEVRNVSHPTEIFTGTGECQFTTIIPLAFTCTATMLWGKRRTFHAITNYVKPIMRDFFLVLLNTNSLNQPGLDWLCFQLVSTTAFASATTFASHAKTVCTKP